MADDLPNPFNEEEQFQRLIRWRWPDGVVVCPHCGEEDGHYFITTRRKFKCFSCHRQFSPTSGTALACSKTPPERYVPDIDIINSHPDLSVAQLAKLLNREYRWAKRYIDLVRAEGIIIPPSAS